MEQLGRGCGSGTGGAGWGGCWDRGCGWGGTEDEEEESGGERGVETILKSANLLISSAEIDIICNNTDKTTLSNYISPTGPC